MKTMMSAKIRLEQATSKKSRFQSEAKCEAIDMKMIFNYDVNKTLLHNKGFALSLVESESFWNSEMAYYKMPVKLSET